MPQYELTRFTPPAPVAYVTLRNPQNGQTVKDVPMLLDSGADVTLLPYGVVQQLGLSLVSETHYELTGFADNSATSPVVALEMSLEGKTFRGQFLLIEHDWGIIGRNILNTQALTLDGPRLTWTLRTSPF